MTTTERIVEAVKKAAHTRNYITGISIDSEALYNAIESVIGQERPKIDLEEVEKLIDCAEDIERAVFASDGRTIPKGYLKKWRNAVRESVGYTLSDLTPPKTKEDGE